MEKWVTFLKLLDGTYLTDSFGEDNTKKFKQQLLNKKTIPYLDVWDDEIYINGYSYNPNMRNIKAFVYDKSEERYIVFYTKTFTFEDNSVLLYSEKADYAVEVRDKVFYYYLENPSEHFLTFAKRKEIIQHPKDFLFKEYFNAYYEFHIKHEYSYVDNKFNNNNLKKIPSVLSSEFEDFKVSRKSFRRAVTAFNCLSALVPDYYNISFNCNKDMFSSKKPCPYAFIITYLKENNKEQLISFYLNNKKKRILFKNGKTSIVINLTAKDMWNKNRFFNLVYKLVISLE